MQCKIGGSGPAISRLRETRRAICDIREPTLRGSYRRTLPKSPGSSGNVRDPRQMNLASWRRPHCWHATLFSNYRVTTSTEYSIALTVRTQSESQITRLNSPNLGGGLAARRPVATRVDQITFSFL